MLSLDDEPTLSTASFDKIGDQNKRIVHNGGMFNFLSLGFPIIYNSDKKKYVPGNDTNNKRDAFVGWYIHYDKYTNLVDVLYRGFLMKDPLKFPITLQQKYIQTYINEQFKLACDTIISNMPRIKKLKRMNLKMLNRHHAEVIYKNINSLIEQYELIYSYEEAMILKAQITTSPFYINDNGIIKIFDMQTNELTMPELESEAYFLAYFSYLNK